MIPPNVSGQQLLKNVVAQLPREPIVLFGDLRVRKRRGTVLREVKFEMLARWGSDQAVATCTVLDPFGMELERLTVSRVKGYGTRLEYAAGNPLSASDPPDLFESVQGTDVSWMDLTLGFLWWEGGSIVGSDEIRGRRCYVVEVPAPVYRDAGGGNRPFSSAAGRRYSRARLWIDEELRTLLQAEGYDCDGKLVRRLWVKSFKKIDDRWVIKDMEIQGSSPAYRTRLCIRGVRVIQNHDAKPDR